MEKKSLVQKLISLDMDTFVFIYLTPSGGVL